MPASNSSSKHTVKKKFQDPKWRKQDQIIFLENIFYYTEQIESSLSYEPNGIMLLGCVWILGFEFEFGFGF